MSREDHPYLDLYCCLPNEFLIAYPQPQLFESTQQYTKKTHRNNNALERTFSLKLSKYRPKNLLHPYRLSKNDIHTSEHRRIEVKELSMSNGDKSNKHDLTKNFNKDPVVDRVPINIRQPVAHTLHNLRVFQNSTSHTSSFGISPSTFTLNRTSTWRRLQANITPSRYHYIQQFQQERQHHQSLSIPHPVMLSPSTKLDQKRSDDQNSSISVIATTSVLEVSSRENTFPSSDLSAQDIEEFQPILELIPSPVPSLFLSDILTSIFPSVSLSPNKDPFNFHTLNNPAEMTEYVIIDQPKTVRSLSESIEELCLLIRKLLQCELNEQKATPVQILLTNQLATLLTYLAISNKDKITDEIRIRDTIERMTSTDENEFSLQQREHLLFTVGTQTNDIAELEIRISPLPIQKVASPTELLSTSVTLHLPGHRLHRALSDTFIYHIRHQQQYSSSYHRFISLSETTIHSLMHRRCSTEADTKHLLQRIEQRFQNCVELESSNTCLEASTEFTPDFLLTTVNNTKYDDDDDDDDDEDQTEQFGIDTDKQEKNDTLTFNSTEKENYDSLELDLGREDKDYAPFNQSDSETLDDNLLSSVVKKLSDRKRLCQWQMPVLPRRTNSTDLIYEKRKGKIDFKHLKIRSSSNSGINLIGKRVRISVDKRCSNQEIPRQSLCLNYNNNCKEQFSSIQSTTSIDSLCFLESDTLDDHPSMIIKHRMNEHIMPSTWSTKKSTHLSEITDRFDSNIALAEGLLLRLDSLNNSNNDLSKEKTDVLHMHIRQFLMEFDARICRNRNKRKNARGNKRTE